MVPDKLGDGGVFEVRNDGVRMDNRCMMSLLDLVKLAALMDRTSGRPEVRIGLIDGPVALGHPDLAAGNIQEVPGGLRGQCAQGGSAGCAHGTFVAGILCGRRGSAAPAICPGCTLLVHPIFPETDAVGGKLRDVIPLELAAALIGCIEAGARVVNLSLALVHSSATVKRKLDDSLNYAAQRARSSSPRRATRAPLGVRDHCAIPGLSRSPPATRRADRWA